MLREEEAKNCTNLVDDQDVGEPEFGPSRPEFDTNSQSS